MIQLTTACVSSVDEAKGNTSNLLFSGQILPERNGGLNGAPSVRLEPGATCVAAVFDGKGSAARKAAYLAAGAFRGAVGELHGVEDLEALYAKAHGDIAAAAAEEDAEPMSAAAVAAVVEGDRLALANLGACRAYLMRDKALYRLSRASAECASQSVPPYPGEGPALGEGEAAAAPFTVKGALLPDDQLLLCTGWLCSAVDEREILHALAESETPSDALLRLAGRAGTGSGDIAGVLLKATLAPEAEEPAEAEA